MRVSVTLTDDVNKLISKHAKSKGVSKDKFISTLVDDFLNDTDLPRDYYKSTCDIQLKTIKRLSDENKMLKEELDKLRVHNSHNSRGAGRKKQFGDAYKLSMKSYKANGMSYREIAKIYNCSVATVHKLINEQD